MNNKIVEEVTVKELIELIMNADIYPSEMCLEIGKQNNKETYVRCIVTLVPMEDCKKSILSFRYERKTYIEIPYEIIRKISVEKCFNGLITNATIQCDNNMEYYLNFTS